MTQCHFGVVGVKIQYWPWNWLRCWNWLLIPWTGVVAFLVLEFAMMIDNNKYNVITIVKLHGVLMMSYMAYGFIAMFMGQIKWGHNV